MNFLSLHKYDEKTPIIVNIHEIATIEEGPLVKKEVLDMEIPGVETKGSRITLKSNKVIMVLESISFIKNALYIK